MQHQTDAICRAAVKFSGDAIRFVQNQTEQLCLLAVKNGWGTILRYINNPSEKVIRLAVNMDRDNLPYVKDKALIARLGLDREEDDQD